VGTQDAAIPTFLFHISHIFPAKTSIVIKKCRQFLFFVVPRQFSQDTIASGQKIKFWFLIGPISIVLAPPYELPIKNLIVVYPDYQEVELTHGERTKVSKEDLDIIWYDDWCYNRGYAWSSTRKTGLHNEIMEYIPKDW